MGLNRMMMKNGQSKQLYHLKASHIQENINDKTTLILGFCSKEIQFESFTIPPMGSLSPGEYYGTKIQDVLILIPDIHQNVGYFGIVEFDGKLPENAVGEHTLLSIKIPQLGINWVSLTEYDENTNTTTCYSDFDTFFFDSIDSIVSLENLYLTIAPWQSSASE